MPDRETMMLEKEPEEFRLLPFGPEIVLVLNKLDFACRIQIPEKRKLLPGKLLPSLQCISADNDV